MSVIQTNGGKDIRTDLYIPAKISMHTDIPPVKRQRAEHLALQAAI